MLRINRHLEPIHILHKREMPMAQEAWIVIAGVKVLHYDLDDTLINTSVLTAGDQPLLIEVGIIILCQKIRLGSTN